MRIGKIKYLNCLPYYAGWEETDTYRFQEGTPADINRMIREGEIDVAPISSMEYLKNPDSYLLFPDLGIASRNYVRSVTLLSKKKIEDLNGATIAVTEESLTSSHLLDLILTDHFNFQVNLVSMPSDPKTMIENCDAALLIGNDALFAHPKKWIFRYDLGNLWHEWQQSSFVYAVWAIRRASDLKEAQIQELYQSLKARFLYNREHLPEIIEKSSSLGEFDRFYPKVLGYLSGLQYILDQQCWDGFKKFAELSQKRQFCNGSEFNFIGTSHEVSV